MRSHLERRLQICSVARLARRCDELLVGNQLVQQASGGHELGRLGVEVLGFGRLDGGTQKLLVARLNGGVQRTARLGPVVQLLAALLALQARRLFSGRAPGVSARERARTF